MKKNEILSQESQDPSTCKALINTTEYRTFPDSGKKVKKIFYLSGLVGFGFLLKSCVPGYVSSEPSYSENTRPVQPSSLHIWVDGDWAWSRQSHTYTHSHGYWTKPRQGRTYITGHWQSGPKGHSWAPGRWARENRNNNNGRR